ncbi:MAG: CHASE4 domain-containing protein [Methanobacteriaceae archaeon]|nr:CHASE4 domain-containing protein [Methanobacteriaceae archaeon]MDP2835421.1 CHASE4 domain-containing protein [Methanobacteriaceae archaeon]MDP3486232.1 CHASE4 domain-containing protein [Methanobacteriaceae archaeon]MDP3624143.1 CHASE4 domain-containing protein [Methanobacteriaceae archaeon]
MALILLSLILSFFIISELFFINAAEDTENQYATMVLQNTINSLNNDLDSINNTANDWSQYDAAYDFVKDNNTNFKERSLINDTFSRLKINFIIFTNNSGDIVFSKAVDLQSKKEIPMYSNINNVTKDYIQYLQEKNTTESSGFIYINGRPLMLVTKPVLRSGGEGPSPGYMIMGRYLDTYASNSLPKNSKLSITPVNSSKDLEVFNNINNSNSNLNQSPIIIKTTNNDFLTGYSILRSSSGRPSLVLKVEMPRSIYKSSQRSTLLLALSLLISGIVAAFLIYNFLDRNLLRRLDKITSSVLDIGKSSDLSGRIPVLGDDELANLAISVNEMLKSLEKSNIELKKSREGYKTIFENTGTAMLLLDKNMDILLANTHFKEIFNLDDGNNNLKDLMAKKDHKKLQDYQLNLESNVNDFKNYELHLINKEGEIRDFYATFSFMKGADEVLISLIDITEHKKTGNKIRESLKEKEILLREIHHRVKNNLQIISVLLSLQSEEIDDPEILEKYKESENRIHSMALIHEKMYQSNDLSSIDFTDYVKNLIADITYAYGFDSSSLDITMDLNNYNMSIETVMPLGLIINELVSNSLKYAFQNKSSKKINIILEKLDNDQFKLEISDNGIGFPENIDFKNTSSLGLQLVNELVQQIDGQIEVFNKKGTNFIINFQEPEYKKRI